MLYEISIMNGIEVIEAEKEMVSIVLNCFYWSGQGNVAAQLIKGPFATLYPLNQLLWHRFVMTKVTCWYVWSISLQSMQ